MSEEKHKALDKRNFNQNKSESNGNEIKQGNNSGFRRMLAMAMQRQGQDKKRQDSNNRDDQQHSQHNHAQVDAPVHAASCPGQNVFNHVPGFQGEKEKWGAVTHG